MELKQIEKLKEQEDRIQGYFDYINEMVEQIPNKSIILDSNKNCK